MSDSSADEEEVGPPTTETEAEVRAFADAPFEFSALQLMATRSALLTDVARLLIRGSDALALASKVVEKIGALLDYDRCTLAVAEEGGETYSLRTLAERREGIGPYERAGVSKQLGFAGRVFGRKRVTYIPDTSRLDAAPTVVDLAMEGGSLRTVLAVPMRVGGRVLGVLTLGSERVDAYGGAEVKLARTVSDMLALAVERQQRSDRLGATVERLQKTNLELDTFIYSASHDLRAPLLSMAGLTDLARLALAGGDVEELSEYLDRIHRNVQRLDAVVVDILQIGRARRMEEVVEPTRLHSLIGEVFESLGAMDSAHDVDLLVTCKHTDAIPLERRRLRQVLNNLIANGIEYRRWDKTPAFVRVIALVEGRELIIRVINNGEPIPEQQRERVFEMFYRASTLSRGSGLGLYLVRQHARAMGGEVRLMADGENTTFEVRIPVKL